MNRCSVGFHKYIKIDEHISIQQIMDKIVNAYDPLLQSQVRDCILELYNVIQPEALSIRYPGRKVCIKCGKIKNKILKHGKKMLKAVRKKRFSTKKKYLKKCTAKKLFILDQLKSVRPGSDLEEAMKNRILELDKIITNLTDGVVKDIDVEVRALLRKL